MRSLTRLSYAVFSLSQIQHMEQLLTTSRGLKVCTPHIVLIYLLGVAQIRR